MMEDAQNIDARLCYDLVFQKRFHQEQKAEELIKMLTRNRSFDNWRFPWRSQP